MIRVSGLHFLLNQNSRFTMHIASHRANERKFSFIAGKVTSTWSLKTFLEFFGRNILLKSNLSLIHPHGWVAIAPACHAGDRVQFPDLVKFFFFLHFLKIPSFLGFSTPQKGVTIQSYTIGTKCIQPICNETLTDIFGIRALSCTSKEFTFEIFFTTYTLTKM